MKGSKKKPTKTQVLKDLFQNPKRKWQNQEAIKWTKQSANMQELVARIKKETGYTVDPVDVRRAISSARSSGMIIPDLKSMYSASGRMDTSDEAVKRSLELRNAKLSSQLTWEQKHKKALERELAQAEERARFWEMVKGADEISIKPLRRKKSLREGTPIMMASDWHVEEVVEPEKVNYANEYNPKIAKQRAERFFQGGVHKIQQCMSMYTCDQVILWGGGDFITGFIHDCYKETNAMSPVQATRYWKGLFKSGIEMMLEELSEMQKLYVVLNYGNHGRTTRKPVDGSIAAANSFEHGAYWDLKEMFKNEPRVEFRIAESTLEYVQVYDWTIRFTHGDKGVKFRDAIGGISTAVRKAVMGWDTARPADYTVMGHWHQWTAPFQDILVNGSLIGYNPFALDIKATWEPPQQGFWVLDEERGRRHTESIWVSEYGARKPERDDE